LINKWVNEAIDLAIQSYQEEIDDRFEDIKNEKYVKQDGSVPFKNP